MCFKNTFLQMVITNVYIWSISGMSPILGDNMAWWKELGVWGQAHVAQVLSQSIFG